MKCAACGHTYNVKVWEEGYVKEEDFIILSLTNEIKLTSEGEGMWDEPKSHVLYACPKCGTVKIKFD